MASATLSHELEIDYDVEFRELTSPHAGRNVSSKERFHARARYSRRGKGCLVNGTHRRCNKRRCFQY